MKSLSIPSSNQLTALSHRHCPGLQTDVPISSLLRPAAQGNKIFPKNPCPVYKEKVPWPANKSFPIHSGLEHRPSNLDETVSCSKASLEGLDHNSSPWQVTDTPDTPVLESSPPKETAFCVAVAVGSLAGAEDTGTPGACHPAPLHHPQTCEGAAVCSPRECPTLSTRMPQ